jgi:hypothetical protein
MIEVNELRREFHSARRKRVSTALAGITFDAGAITALRCRKASSAWEAICNSSRTQTRTARPGPPRR